MSGLFDLDNFLDTEITESVDTDDSSLSSYLESMLFECNQIISDLDSTEEEVTEATRLSKEIHKAHEKDSQLTSLYDDISSEIKRLQDGKSYRNLPKDIKRKVDYLEDQQKKIKNQYQKMIKGLRIDPETGSDGIEQFDSMEVKNIEVPNYVLKDRKANQKKYYGSDQAKPKKGNFYLDMQNKNNKLKKISESFDEILDNYSDLDNIYEGVDESNDIGKGKIKKQQEDYKKSFKEAVGIINELINRGVLDDEPSFESYEEAAEAAAAKAYMDFFENGDYFAEEVTRANKDDIKPIVKKIRSKATENYVMKKFGKVFVSLETAWKRFNKFHFSGDNRYYYQWQVIGYIFAIDDDEKKEIANTFNEEFEDLLGDYKIFVARSSALPYAYAANLVGKNAFQKIGTPTKGGGKCYGYIIYVDKNENSDMNKAAAAMGKDATESKE